jgi:cytochrome b subunit of formate dehydrogenase
MHRVLEAVPRVEGGAQRRTYRKERIFLWIDRSAAWFSAGLVFLYFLSGFGMTKPDFVHQVTGGLITWRVSYDMHNVLEIPLIVVFLFHTFMGVRRTLLRRTKHRRTAAWTALSAGTLMLGFLLVLALGPTGF